MTSIFSDWLVLADIILISIIFIICIFLHNRILNFLGDFSGNLRSFLGKYSGFFTILFLILFAFEQLLLIVGAYYFNVAPKLQMFIGIFALVVVSTATLEKFVWEYKFTKRNEELIKVSNDNNLLFSDVENLIAENRELKKKKR